LSKSTAEEKAVGANSSLSRIALMFPLTFASYNIHRCIGLDGRHDPDRIAAVLCELEADVIALQEVDAGYHVDDGIDQIVHLAQATGFKAVSGPVLKNHRGTYGNGLLIRHEPVRVRRVDLSVPGRERRGALDVDLEIDGVRVRVVAAHLGLRPRERQVQVSRLLDALRGHDGGPMVLLGDFNEWLTVSPVLNRLHRRFGRSPGVRSFPSRFPVFALDRVWVQPRAALLNVEVHTSPRARVASDHLPVRALVDRLDGPEARLQRPVRA
jgi:endonuclease/exonuclease/phosphatase family metal-dependent hydrolase